MKGTNKVNPKIFLLFVFAFLFCESSVQSRHKTAQANAFHIFLTARDTIPQKQKSPLSRVIPPVNNSSPKKIQADTVPVNPVPASTEISPNDTSAFFSDSVNVKISKDGLDAPVEYSAEDSMVLDVSKNKMTLYGRKASTQYKDNNLTAPVIQFDQTSGDITAALKRDSAGKIISLPTFKQGDFNSQSDSIRFNIKSLKGITKSTYTQQGEMYVYGEVIKKVSNEVFFAQRSRFTTCDLDTPHFAFVSSKVKFINQKVAITGPVHPEFEGVPVPIYLPFGIYPLKQGRRSGFLPPQFAANQQLGLGLEGIGYYKILSDYWDVVVRGNIYSYGGWTMNINPRYTKKYSYNGSFSFDVQNFKSNFKGDPDFSQNKSYRVAWTHTIDNKARPGVNFSANVNAASSSFNSLIPNNPYKNFSNQLTSSIVYSRTWKDKPYNLTVSANHNQNTNQKLVNVNLPDVAFNVTTIYPFRNKEGAGTPKWYENLGVGYNVNAKSLFSFYDTAKNIFKHIKDTFQWGAQHSVPISVSLPPVGPFQFSPSISYSETWYQQKFIRSWNSVLKKVDTTVTRGFYTARDMSFGIGMSTAVYGVLTSKSKNAKIVAIRHEMRPSISLSYHPDFNRRNYYVTQVDTLKNKAMFSYFEGNIFSYYGSGRAGNIGFSLDNNIQAKVRNKKSALLAAQDSLETGGQEGENAIQKIMLIDGLNFSGSYNLLADSFNLSTFAINAHSSLFNNKLNITAGATLDPYDVDNSGRRLKTLLWKRKPVSLGRLTNANISVSSQFSGGNKSGANNNRNIQRTNDFPVNSGYSRDEYQTELAYIRNNPGEYADFNIPWSVNFSYALNFNKVLKQDYSGFENDFSQNVNFGGTLNLTPKWQVGLNGFYNITLRELNTISVSISREMHCWQMGINLSPVGKYRFFSINISPKSALLRDLRINRTRSSYDL